MPGVALVGTDTAGGTITGQLQSRVFDRGRPVAVVGDAVAPHPPPPPPHQSATMAEGSSRVFIDGIAICRSGDAATCGHAATGQSHHVDA